jgi:hypothetical protein
MVLLCMHVGGLGDIWKRGKENRRKKTTFVKESGAWLTSDEKQKEVSFLLFSLWTERTFIGC